MATNTHSTVGWAISFAKRRANAAKAQGQDLLLTSARNAAHDTAVRPTPRLPFNGISTPMTARFYHTYDKCILSDGHMRYIIRNQVGLALDEAATLEDANAKVDALNASGGRNAGVQRFATGRKYKVVSNGD